MFNNLIVLSLISLNWGSRCWGRHFGVLLFGDLCLAVYSYYLKIWNFNSFKVPSIMVIGLACGMGIASCVISFALTTPRLIENSRLAFAGLNAIRLSKLVKAMVQMALLTALYEEWLWRLCIQSSLVLFSGPKVGVGLTALAFTSTHGGRFQHQKRRIAEFLLFSAVLGLIFLKTQNIWVVVMIHCIRNMLILVYRFGILEATGPLKNRSI